MSASSDWVGSRNGLGTALDFDGSNDHVSLTSPSNLGLLGDTFTASAWVRLDNTNGDNTIIATDEDDVIVGFKGDDILTGDLGADVFVFNDADGFDTITDFEKDTDTIDLVSLGITYADLTISDDGVNATIAYSDDGSGSITGQIQVDGLLASDLTEDQFVFV